MRKPHSPKTCGRKGPIVAEAELSVGTRGSRSSSTVTAICRRGRSTRRICPPGGTTWPSPLLVSRAATVYPDGQPVAFAGVSPRRVVFAPTLVGYGGYEDCEGGVDEVAVYGWALDAGRIAAHYQAGRPSFTSTKRKPPGLPDNGVFDLTDGAAAPATGGLQEPHRCVTCPLTATDAATDSVIALDGSRLSPQYGLATGTRTDDSGGPTPGHDHGDLVHRPRRPGSMPRWVCRPTGQRAGNDSHLKHRRRVPADRPQRRWSDPGRADRLQHQAWLTSKLAPRHVRLLLTLWRPPPSLPAWDGWRAAGAGRADGIRGRHAPSRRRRHLPLGAVIAQGGS